MLCRTPIANAHGRSARILSRSSACQRSRPQCRVTASLVSTAGFRSKASYYPTWRMYAACVACVVTGFTGMKAITKPHQLDSPSPTPVRRKKQTYPSFIHPVSPENAEIMLHNSHNSTIFTLGGSTVRKDYAQVAGNSPSEDESSSGYIYFGPESSPDSTKSRRLFNAIYDGHAGTATALVLNSNLSDYVVRELKPRMSLAEQDQAIKNAFLKMDEDIMNLAAEAVTSPRTLADANAEVVAAFSGSCALASIFDEETRILKIANTGDSRAILGRKDSEGKWAAIPLSTDHTGNAPSEITRLQQAHPNEPEMLKNGRLLGLAVTRAFGDARWKWSRELQEKAKRRFFGPKIQEPLMSPPYLTAEPEISSIQVSPTSGDFLIMASDGLWDKLSNDQAVQLVARWRVLNDLSEPAPEPSLPDMSFPQVGGPMAPVRSPSTSFQPKPDFEYSSNNRVTERDYIFKDGNAAIHLARHALGGGNIDLFTGLMMPEGFGARKMRDDITVIVVFF